MDETNSTFERIVCSEKKNNYSMKGLYKNYKSSHKLTQGCAKTINTENIAAT